MKFQRRPLLAGNWKMNGLRTELAEIAKMAEAYDARLRENVAPPATATISWLLIAAKSMSALLKVFCAIFSP